MSLLLLSPAASAKLKKGGVGFVMLDLASAFLYWKLR